MTIAVSAKRVGPPWISEFWPACVGGHRVLMERAVDIDAYVCPECNYVLPAMEWLRYLER